MSNPIETEQESINPKSTDSTLPQTETPVSVPVPYLNSYGNIAKVLEKIKSASTPPRFTQDFLSAKLNMTGGGATPLIPFLKKTGFLNGDGTPTDLYKKFRNPALSSKAAADAMRKGYAPLYEINEYVHDLKDEDLKGVIVQATGLDSKSSTVRGILGSFKAIKKIAVFDENETIEEKGETSEVGQKQEPYIPQKSPRESFDLKLGYVINLNLPASSDVAVFDAIFKSLRKNILE